MLQINLYKSHRVIMVGIHPEIIQSILDFDYSRGALEPSLIAIVSGNKKSYKCWFGETEILIPVFSSFDEVVKNIGQVDWLINLSSSNSAKRTTIEFFISFPAAFGAHLFCDGLSEQDALYLIEKFGDTKFVAGASGVGFLVPGFLKLGAIGGIYGDNLNILSKQQGDTAIVCSSGGMVNEIITTLIKAGGMPSMAVSFGGDRFPITSPLQWILLAENDPKTNQIFYFGELGGIDEYEIATAVKDGKIKKPIYAYIAGRYESGARTIQFGHAKALANTPKETAIAKTEALKSAGVFTSNSFSEYLSIFNDIQSKAIAVSGSRLWKIPDIPRKNSIFTAARDKGSIYDSFVKHSLCTLLERNSISDELINFTEKAYSVLIDHGAQVSGSVNAMVTARAGKDMSSSLASAILTVGDRFGAAINISAKIWKEAVKNDVSVEELLENYKKKGELIMGIGHLKYNFYNNDPRVAYLSDAAKSILNNAVHIRYAEDVAKRTVQKKPSLILNIDGLLGAALIDIFIECEGFSNEEIDRLLMTDFLNSYFLVPRTVGFIGNYLSQKRRDEGLFRLPDDLIFYD